jgi:protein phosphatase slingshot
MGQSGIFPYDKDEIPWHPGTVKRTKQKIEESNPTIANQNATIPPVKKTPTNPTGPANSNQVAPNLEKQQIDAKNNNQKILCDIKKSLLIDSLSNLQQKTGGAFFKAHARCKSEEMICRGQRAPSRGEENDRNNNQRVLSVSAPSGGGNFQWENQKLQQRRQNQLRKLGNREDEPADKKSNKNKDNSSTQMGKLKNLKMYFESKASDESQKSCSVPSSPIAVHVDVKVEAVVEPTREDINVKGLVDKYEVTKRGHVKHNSLPTTGVQRNRPKSMMETKSSVKNPLMLTHSSILKGEDFGKPPVIPAGPQTQMPVVKNTLFSSNNPTIQINQKNPTTGCRKIVQQQGKTHPLSKLGIGKRLNTTPAYNTM